MALSVAPSLPTPRAVTDGLTRQEHQLLSLLPETADAPMLTGDLIARSRFSPSSCYRALHQLAWWGAIDKVTVRLPSDEFTRARHLVRHAKAYWRTAAGTQLLETATLLVRKPPKAKPNKPASRPEHSLLDESNTSVAAITFRTAMAACGLTSMDALAALETAPRRHFEEVWTQVMYDRCAAAGTPIETANPPREHGMMPPRKKT